MELSCDQQKNYDYYAKDYLNNPTVLMMKDYIAHGRITVYDHCLSVSKCAFKLAKDLNLKVDEKTLIVGGLLHDLYLYDWHDASVRVPLFKMHGFTHPEKARKNAEELLNVDKDIQEVIVSHMWPLTLKACPKSKEAWLICIADKKVALEETLFKR